MVSQKEVMNSAYTAAAVTAGAVGVSMASRKFLKTPMEKLTAAKEKWYENQVEKKNEMELLRQQLSDANADINKTNKALDNLRKITYENRTFEREPHISDFYEPSDEMREYQHAAVGLAGLIGGWGVYKLI